MFDTVAGKFEKGPYLPKDESRNPWETRTREFFDTKLGARQTSTTHTFNRPEARVAIYGDGAILRVEASLPKLLYGNNLATVCDAELPLNRLHEFVSDHVNGEIPELGLMDYLRVDYAHNFRVGQSLADYVSTLGQLSFLQHRRTTDSYGAATGTRIGEAVGIKWSDFDGNTLHIQRRIYERKEGTTKTKGSNRSIPIPAALLERMKLLGEGEWVFRSQAGTPVDPKNAANRYLRPAAAALGIKLGGWHDFRHTLSTQMLKRYPTKVVSELLGHSSVQTTLSVYQHVETEDFRTPMNEMTTELLLDVTKLKLAAA